MRRPERALLTLFAVLASAGAAAALQRTPGPAPEARQEFHWEALRRYRTQEGLPQNSVQALAQDREGFVYAATEDGVAQFDGREWRRMALPERDGARPFGSQLIAPADGSVWMGTDIAGLWRRDPDGTIAAVPGIPERLSIEALIARDQESVYAGTPRGVYRCVRTGCTPIASTVALEVAALLRGVGPNGDALWIGTNIDGLYRVDAPEGADPKLAPWHLEKADGLPNSSVRSLAQWGGAQGTDLWVGCGRGIARIAGDSITVYDVTSGFFEGTVAPLLAGVDDAGRPLLRAGLARSGLAEFRDDGSVAVITRAEGLPENAVTALLETGVEGGHRLLWIGTNSSGLARREPQRWTALDERHGLPHRVIFGIGRARFLDGVDTMWVGTIEGPARWIEGGWHRFLPEAYARSTLFAVANTPGHVWLATDRGLIDWSDSGWVEYTSDNSALPGLSVLDVLPDSSEGKDIVWLGTRHGLARLVDGKIEVVPVPELGGQPLSRVLLLAPAPDGREHLWLAGSEGLAWFDGKQWHKVETSCLPYPDLMDLRLHRDATGRAALWAATRAGITRIGVGATLQCDSLDAQQRPPGQVYNFAFDASDRLYAFGSSGVTRYQFAPGPGLAVLRRDSFGLAEGLPGLEFNRTSFSDAQGRIWAGSVDGLALYDPGTEVGAGSAAPLRLMQARSERGTHLQDGAKLVAGDDSVQIDVALLSYERPEQIRYLAELDGLPASQPQWSESGRFDFTRLPPGKFRLTLRARDAYGVEAVPLHLAFSIAAPWWRSNWALGALALLLMLAGLGIGRLRSAALRRRAQALEHEVGLRTAELAEANQRLEHASLTDPLTGLWNRRHFSVEVPRHCEQLLGRIRDDATHAAFALLLVDCDHFKRINDSHGHAVGDAVLVEIAQRLRSLGREGDVLLRWGGEEFLLLFDAVQRDAVEPLARRVLQAIAATPFPIGGELLNVTCSIGCSLFPFDPRRTRQHSLDQCLRLADAALYRAKRSGRNRAAWVRSTGDESRLDWQDIPFTPPTLVYR
ncbi:MAG: diguanylate cyclase [Tahibacter sp.]